MILFYVMTLRYVNRPFAKIEFFFIVFGGP